MGSPGEESLGHVLAQDEETALHILAQLDRSSRSALRIALLRLLALLNAVESGAEGGEES